MGSEDLGSEIYRWADVAGQTRDVRTGVQTEVGGTAPSSRDGVGEVSAQGSKWRCGGSRDSIEEGTPLVVVCDGLTRLEVGADEVDAEAEARRVSRATLLLLGVGAGEADRIAFETNLSKSDTVPLVAVVRG